MNKSGKILIIGILIFLLAISPIFSQTPEFKFDIDQIVDPLKTFSGSMATALPFNSTLGLNWSDAYIGQLLALPPHFGIGFTIGATTIGNDLSVLDPLLEILGMEGGVGGLLGDFPNIGFPLPSVMLEARVGGIILPFDIGVKYMNLSQFGLDNMISGFLGGINFEYELIGADLRYSIFSPGAFINISAGVGVNHLRGGVGINFTDGVNFEGVSVTTNASAGLFWETTMIEAKAQVSFPLFIITPYVGIGAGYSWSKVGFEVKGDVTAEGELAGLIEEAGLLPSIGDSIRAYEEVNGWNFRLYGGLSLNLFIIRFDVTGMYNLSDGSLGASVGIRLQL